MAIHQLSQLILSHLFASLLVLISTRFFLICRIILDKVEQG